MDIFRNQDHPKQMRHKPVIPVLGLLAAFALAAQDSAKKTDATGADANKPDVSSSRANVTADQVIEKYVVAIGGKEAYQKLRSRAIKATLQDTAGNPPVKAEFYAKAPDKWFIELKFSEEASMREGADSERHWFKNPDGTVSELNKDDMAAMKNHTDFYRDTRLREIFPKMTLKSREKVGGRECYVIEATPKTGEPEKLYFDTESGLLLRNDWEAKTPDGPLPRSYYLEDYQQVDGIKFPHTFRQPATDIPGWTFKITEIKHNVTVDDAMFKKPQEK